MDQSGRTPSPSPGQSGLLEAPALDKALKLNVTFSPLVSPYGSGIYDDRHAGWIYQGAWLPGAAIDAYNNTFTYSSTVGNNAVFVMTGNRFTLTYRSIRPRGVLDIYVDGVRVHSLNQNGPLQWGKTWTSRRFREWNTHYTLCTCRRWNLCRGIDAITVYEPSVPVGSGIFDDTHAGWSYSGLWSVYSGAGPYNNGLHYTGAVGSYAEITFTGTQFTLKYLQHIQPRQAGRVR